MLHEILLSLSGHRSPLLGNDYSDPSAASLISPAERQLLATAAHLSRLHRQLRERTGIISKAHPSAVCRAVSTAIVAVHLSAFQRKILEVEAGILRKDAALVGAYNIVPLTAVIGQFTGWIRRLEWLWELVQFLYADVGIQDAIPCRAVDVIDKLRRELQTGYADVADTALSLLQAAETAWLRQASSWVLYGRIPALAEHDFFVYKEDVSDIDLFTFRSHLMPSFVKPSTASSMLFIGMSINRARSRVGTDLNSNSLNQLASQHRELTELTFPINSAAFTRAILSIRQTLSRTTLQKLLPLAKVLEVLKVLREFFLLGRGEFAMALTQQADEKVRSRWRRADNLAYEKRDPLSTVVVKEGEVAAVLARTWAFLSSMQGQHAEEDEPLELARDLVQLRISKTPSKSAAAQAETQALTEAYVSTDTDPILDAIAPTPFHNFLFSVPVALTMDTPSPLDLFLTPSSLQIYTAINSYLLSIRRAHLRLTDLWKITSLRRHHPPPPRAPYGRNSRAGRAKTKLLRERWSSRSSAMRSTWSTSSAAIFFLGETETYLQVEVVEGLWSHFHGWLTGASETGEHGVVHGQNRTPTTSEKKKKKSETGTVSGNTYEGISSSSRVSTTPTTNPPAEAEAEAEHKKHQHHDPQTIGIAHAQYLKHLVRRLLLTQRAFAAPLFDLLTQIESLVALVHRLHAVWHAADLQADEGVVDAFAPDLAREERDVRAQLRGVEGRVRQGVEDVVKAIRELSLSDAFAAEMEGEGEGEGGVVDDGGVEDVDVDVDEDDDGEGERRKYRPKRVGGIDRLLMKLDFGGWLELSRGGMSMEGVED
ncbi:Spc97/Spc98 family protein [Xylariaceae sp. FL0594]|nr:Spc97/Spc98 family protein [Xylariaceae sp. FL0594]